MNIELKEIFKYTIDYEILYVEDNKDIRETTATLFRDIFKEVDTAENGAVGLKRYLDNQDKYKIIIADINMPQLNGIEMAKKIKQYNPNIPIILISAHSDIEYFINSIEIGIDAYLLKPFSLSQFKTAMYKIVYKLELEAENKEYKKYLEEKVTQQIKTIQENEKMLYHQSKLASMGEIIDVIAHQWKQPLGVIKMATEIEHLIENNALEAALAMENSQRIQKQVNYLLETIDEFRKFLRPDFTLESVKNSVETLLKDELMKNKISLIFKGELQTKIKIIPNEFKHILINMINNSKYAFIENGIKDREIVCDFIQNQDNFFITVTDNAGGIKGDIIDRVFDANASTKGSEGTGIGLYMSKQIVEKIGGHLMVENVENGACFTIIIPK